MVVSMSIIIIYVQNNTVGLGSNVYIYTHWNVLSIRRTWIEPSFCYACKRHVVTCQEAAISGHRHWRNFIINLHTHTRTHTSGTPPWCLRGVSEPLHTELCSSYSFL